MKRLLALISGGCSNAHRLNVASVASFFVSRVYTQVDKALDAIGSPQALALCGNIAIANAKAMYRDSMRFSVEKSSRHSDAVAHEYKGPCGSVPERKAAPTATSCMSRN